MTTPTTTQPTQAGREKCKPWCGAEPGSAAWKTYGNAPENVFNGGAFAVKTADGGLEKTRYCSPGCLAAKSPPLTPPTPAPAREVKVGQRYQSSRTGNICKVEWINLATGRLGLCWETGAGSVNWPLEEFVDRKWTLLDHAPATSEPGRACSCGQEDDEPHTPGCPAEPPRPAQEAAKAPVCSAFPSTLHGRCSGNVLERHRYNGRRFLCDGHFLAFESRDFEAMNDDAKPTGLLRDPKVSERLPRPRLTHSAMWADECEDA